MKKVPKTFLVIWAIFVLSFFLPAMKFSGDNDSAHGWQCAWWCATVPLDPQGWQVWKWDGKTLYYFLFTVPNLMMIVSPLILLFVAKHRVVGWTLTGFSVFSVLYTFSYWVVGIVDHEMPFRIGYYLWLGSFAAFCAAMFCLMQRDSTSPPTPACATA